MALPLTQPPATALGGSYASFTSMDAETAPLCPEGYAAGSAYGAKTSMPSRRRRRWNFYALCLAVLLPWSIFVSVFAVMSFHFPRSLNWSPWSSFVGSAQLSFAICAICLLIVIALGCAALSSWTRPKVSAAQEPTWYTMLFLSALIAWAAGLGFGDLNYKRNMKPYSELTNAGAYYDVDPSLVHSSSVADAGRISFQVGSKLDVQMAMAYTDVHKQFHTFCVAPFATEKVESSARHDFWSVGMDCCHKRDNERIVWSCNPEIRQHRLVSGLRYRGDEDGFTLALKQAQAKFNITVADPIFIVRTDDADEAVDWYQEQGIHTFLTGIFVHLASSICLVAVTVRLLTWLGW